MGAPGLLIRLSKVLLAVILHVQQHIYYNNNSWVFLVKSLALNLLMIQAAKISFS